MKDNRLDSSFFNRLPVDESPLLIDGHSPDWYACSVGTEGVVLGSAQPATSYVDMAGLPGGADATLRDATGAATPGRRDVTVHLVASSDELELAEAKLRVGQLNGRRVSIRWQPWRGELTGDVSVGAWTETWNPPGEVLWMETTLTISCDPLLVGEWAGFSTDTDGDDVTVEGTRPSYPLVTATPPAGTKRFYVTVRNSAGETTLKVDADYDGATELRMDSLSRTSLYGDTPVFPLIDSDYPMLVPGRNHVSVSAGTALIAYQPLYMI